MPWLMAYIAQHIVGITLLGTVAVTVSSVEVAALNGIAIVEKIEGK